MEYRYMVVLRRGVKKSVDYVPDSAYKRGLRKARTQKLGESAYNFTLRVLQELYDVRREGKIIEWGLIAWEKVKVKKLMKPIRLKPEDSIKPEAEALDEWVRNVASRRKER